MRTRSDKELLIILRDNIHLLKTGICFLTRQLCDKGIITEEEQTELLQYINIHRPKMGTFEKYYFWPPREQEPRLHWINQQLKK